MTKKDVQKATGENVKKQTTDEARPTKTVAKKPIPAQDSTTLATLLKRVEQIEEFNRQHQDGLKDLLDIFTKYVAHQEARLFAMREYLKTVVVAGGYRVFSTAELEEAFGDSLKIRGL